MVQHLSKNEKKVKYTFVPTDRFAKRRPRREYRGLNPAVRATQFVEGRST